MMRIHVPIHLRWGDLDAYNHLNNVQSMRILEEARVRAFWRLDAGADDVSTAVFDAAAGAQTQTLIANHHVEYLLPVPYQLTPLDVQLWIGRIGGASLDICYEVLCAEGLAIRAATTMVFADAATGSPRRITEQERAAMADYVEEPIVFRR
jgi:acyl-CoA thioester hydrolase